MDQTVVMLRDIEPGQRARVKKLAGEQRLKRRLMDMGITPGIEVGVVKVAPLGDPVELTVRGYELSIRKDEAAHIEVEKL
jgi:ferrous iron transport protein A